MRLLGKNHLENAIEALRANRLRTALTIIGVTIGVASISAVLSLAGGATKFLSGQIANTSNSVALVRSSLIASTPESLLADFQSLHSTTTLTEQDSRDLEEISGAKVAPMAILHTSLKARDSQVDGHSSTLIGSNPALIDVASLNLLEGDFISDSSQSVVIGSQLAVDLFGTEHALGNILYIRGQTFTVSGVLKATKQPINYLGVDFDRSAIIALSSIKQFSQNVAQIQQIVINTNDGQPLSPVTGKAEQILKENHLGEKDFTILTGEDITAPSSRLFAGITLTMAIITGISLLVGGIGIMNIMLVNVAERNREVGIRKAVGATSGHIINQFLIESAIIGLLGGVIGYLIGLAAAFLLGMYLPFTPILEWQVAALSIGVALLTGIIFGIYPAARASRKNPIISLRQ